MATIPYNFTKIFVYQTSEGHKINKLTLVEQPGTEKNEGIIKANLHAAPNNNMRRCTNKCVCF